MSVKRITPTRADFRDLFQRLHRALAPGIARPVDDRFRSLLLANIGSPVQPGTERDALLSVYIPLWISLSESSRLNPASVVGVQWPPTPVSVERDADSAAAQYGQDDPRARALDDALFEALGPGEGEDAHLADPLFGLRTAINTEIMRQLAYRIMGWRYGEPSVTLSANTPQVILDELRARGYRVVFEPGTEDDVDPSVFEVFLGVALPPASDQEIYERIRQEWRNLIHAYDERETGRNPVMGINVNTPGAVLNMLEADGYHFRREGGHLVMY